MSSDPFRIGNSDYNIISNYYGYLNLIASLSNSSINIIVINDSLFSIDYKNIDGEDNSAY